MKVSGFTFIRNGSSLGYPFIESIKSILPICDEFIVALGKSEDDTLNKIRALKSKKLRLLKLHGMKIFLTEDLFTHNKR